MIIEVRVKKGNRKPEKTAGFLLIYTDAERRNNQANMDVIKQVALYFGVSTLDVHIRTGRSRTRKQLEVDLKS